MIRSLTLTAAVLTAAVSMTLAATPSTAQVIPQPAIGAPKPASLPATEDFQLSNGIKVTLIPYVVVPKTIIAVRVPTGNLADGEDVWISDVTVALMREGAGNRSGAEFSQAFADMGGSLSSGVNRDNVMLSTNVLSERAPEAIGLLADMLQRPTMPAEPLERIKQGFIRNATISLSTPSGQAANAYYNTVFKGHPYGDYLPKTEQLQAYSLEQAKAFYAGNFGSNGVRIYVAGQFDAATIKAELEKQFGSWQGNNAVATLTPTPAMQRRVVLVDRPGALQSSLMLVASAPSVRSPDYVEAEVMDSLLGGAFNSRITTNIREDKGYTYSPYSYLSVLDNNTTHWSMNAEVTAAHTGDSLKEIFHEIRKLQGEVPTQDETTGTKNMSTGGFVMSVATTSGVINSIIRLDARNMPRDHYDRYIAQVLAVTPQDIQKAAQQIDLNKMTLIVVGDLASVRAQLEALPELQGVTFEVFQP